MRGGWVGRGRHPYSRNRGGVGDVIGLIAGENGYFAQSEKSKQCGTFSDGDVLQTQTEGWRICMFCQVPEFSLGACLE